MAGRPASARTSSARPGRLSRRSAWVRPSAWTAPAAERQLGTDLRKIDDAIIHATLRDANISLVSVTENIDETPSGMLMHGILASMAEFYSLNLAQEVLKA